MVCTNVGNLTNYIIVYPYFIKYDGTGFPVMRDSREKRFVPDLFSVSANQCVTELGVGGRGVSFPGKKRYEGVWFNVISITRGGWGSNSQEKALLNTSMAPMSEH